MNKTQITVLLGSIVIIVLLLFADTKLPASAEKKPMYDHSGPSATAKVTAVVDMAKSSLDANHKKTFKGLDEELSASSNKIEVFEKIIHEWDALRQPVVAAYYAEQAAQSSLDELDWKKAGERYYAATKFVKKEEHQMLFNKALVCFEKTLALNPDNIDAKIKLASCYVEGTGEPMKGIGMLRDIEKTDSNNVNLQLSFAFFSEKSGQWDKAIGRFEKVLKIEPSFIEAYLHLADAYDRKGETDKVIEYLEKYVALVEDESVKVEIRNYINKLKN